MAAPSQVQQKDQLRFITCGSVDDGKSTLVGRLLADAGAITDDQMATLRAEAKGGAIDYSRLLDGLLDEREQGITIDVAYRYFSTPRRAFIVADAPGHEQYTRNMITGASTADAAVVLVDARKGVLTQTRRHSLLVSLIGVKTVILAVTKMDLVGWDRAVFEAIETEYRAFAGELGIERVLAVPTSGVTGGNVVEPAPETPWYSGPALLSLLETLPVEGATDRPFRMPVQAVSRPDQDFRGYQGRNASGVIRPGDAVRVSPSGVEARVARIVEFGGDRNEAGEGRSTTLVLDREVDVSRGDVIAAASDPVEAADQFEATIVWMAEEPLLPGRVYDLKLGARTVPAQVTEIKHQVDVNSLEKLAAKTLALNAVAVCNLSLGAEVGFEPYAVSRDLGGFILIDRQTFTTVGAGMIHFALRRAHNIHRQALSVGREERAALKGQKQAVVWFTGLSGAGKSTVANALEGLLTAEGRHAVLLDGDNLRHGLNRDLGFTDADRVENIRRAAETARLMADAGLIVLVSLISPFAAERRMARELMPEGEFFEVFVDAPLEVVEGRDVKGLYAKARAGQLANFTGIDSPYEPPEAPEVHIRTDRGSAEDAARMILERLRAAGRLRP